MAKRVRTHTLGDSPTDPDLRPKHLTKQEFGKRLYRLMISKGWHQSELARRADVARDSVSTYVRGVSLPDPSNLEKLARALGVDPVDLLPNHMEAAIDNDVPSLEMKVSGNDPRVAWLRINRLVSTATCVKVVELLGGDVLPERK
jgi:transcriptional regulator with XRE-family HTH domain